MPTTMLTSLFICFATTLAYTSLFMRSVYVKVFSAAYQVFAKKEVKRLQSNLQKVLGMAMNTSLGRSFAKQCIRHQMIATLHGLEDIFAHKPVSIDNLTEFNRFMENYRAANQGLIIISAHVGCWELVAKYARLGLGKKLSVLAKPARSRTLTAFLEDTRKRAGVSVLWNESKLILREMLSVLRKGEGLGFVMDQKPLNRVGYRTDFYGYPADFVTGPAAIALRAKVPVIGVYLMRTFDRNYTFVYDAIWDGAEPLTEEQLLERMVRSMEAAIKVYPEQWTWSYKRWTFA